MSCVCVFTPDVIAEWPLFSEIIVAAATSLGFTTASGSLHSSRRVNLEIEQSEIVTNQLGRDQKISVTRDGVIVTFARDSRGRASLCVEGKTAHNEAALRAIGEELSGRVVQTYIYQRLIEEMRARQFTVVEEETTANHSIRLKVRRWDS